jgi:hypothetical protein
VNREQQQSFLRSVSSEHLLKTLEFRSTKHTDTEFMTLVKEEVERRQLPAMEIKVSWVVGKIHFERRFPATDAGSNDAFECYFKAMCLPDSSPRRKWIAAGTDECMNPNCKSYGIVLYEGEGCECGMVGAE